jgi:hypothetical protein
MTHLFIDDGDEDTPVDLPDPVADAKELGDEIGTKIGEGHDDVEDSVL